MTCCAYSCTQYGLFFLKLLGFVLNLVKDNIETYHKFTPQFVELQSGRWGGLLLLFPGTSPPTPLQLLQLPCQFFHLRNCQRQLLLLFIEKRSDWIQIGRCRNTQKVSMDQCQPNRKGGSPVGDVLWSEWEEDADNTRHIKYWNIAKA